MIETVAIWIAGKTVGALVEPVLKDLAKDIAKDVAKDKGKGFVNRMLGRATKLIPHDEFIKAYGKAIAELVQTIDEELCNAGVPEHQTDAWANDAQQFIRTEIVREALQQVFTVSSGKLDGITLQQGWRQLPEPVVLPNEFSWNYVAETFNRKLRKVRTEDADFRAILQAQAAAETADAVQQIAGLPVKSNLNAYREALLERYAHLHFDTMDATGAYERQRQLWSVFVAQTVRDCQEYRPQEIELPKDHQRRLREQGEWGAVEMAEELLELRRRTYLDQAPRSVLEAVKEDRLPRLVILGDPGSGKSSLLRYLALEWARIPDVAAREAAPLPLLIELREYNTWDCPNGKSFVRYLHDAQNWYRLNQFDVDQRLAHRNGAVLLLDGLDEIFDPQRRELAVNDITRFSNEYPNIRIIVTSRVIGYKQQRLSDAEFRHLMLQDLDEPQINDFLERWHDETFAPNRTDREAKQARLAKSISDSRAIRELAGNPLLLTMMAILNRHQELPRDRARLYEQASRVLLHEWDTDRALDSHPEIKGVIGYQEKAEMLRDVAYFMQANASGQVGNIIARSDLERILRAYLQNTLGLMQPHAMARALVEQLRERNFILCYLGADSYAFVHRTFLEFFCASAIVREFRKQLKLEYLKDEVFGRHWHDETWHEVLCLIAGMVADTSVEQVAELIDFLLAQKDKEYKCHHIFLAAQCYQEVRNPKTIAHSREKLLTELTKLLRFDLPYFYQKYAHEETQKRDLIRAKAVGALAVLLPNDPASWLKARVTQGDNYAVRRAAVQELARGWHDAPDTLPWLKARAAQDDDADVRRTAVRELARGWHDDPATLLILKERATQDDRWYVRRAAMQELACGWHDDPDTLPILKARATQDEATDVRAAAVQELVRDWHDDPDTLPILKARAMQDDDEGVRRAAVAELARGFQDDPDTLPWLKERATQDDNWFVRHVAVEELARGWHDDPDTLLILKEWATQDDDEDVRYAAVQELARGWHDDPDTLLILKERATQDDDPSVRQTAVAELARGWHDDPNTLLILKARATQDADWNVRRAAVQELARGFQDDPDTLPWLKERATQDDDEGVRYVAVQELARGFQDDPDTLPWLKERATQDDDEDVRRAAVQELARGWHDDPDTLLILKARATQDDYEGVRQTAVQELARGWHDDPDTLPLLKARATQDDNYVVRRAAVQELARGWKDNPDTLPILKARATQDADAYVRSAAVQELARGWKDDPEVRVLLEKK